MAMRLLDWIIYTCLILELLTLRCVLNESHGRVSIETVRHTGPMTEGREYVLRCNVQYVTPVRCIEVSWYKGKERVKNASFNDTETAASTKTWFHDLTVSHNRGENGTQYKCEAKVITTGGSQAPINESAPLVIIVHYKPVINVTKLPSDVPVFRGYPETLVCEAEGYPSPTITWSRKPYTKVEQGHLNIVEAMNENVGEYICTASNSVGTAVRTVKVTMKEDYLPLIAGFVALVVVIISVIFIVIYTIYYKNTKMGRYSVEGAKPNAQNGNVAQNGKDNSIPMKKLSQNSICV